MKAELLLDAQCNLAEGIQWRTDQQRLWWTDIHGCALWSCDADGENARTIATPERLGSFAFDPNGYILGAFESGLFKWDFEGDRVERICRFEPEHATSRLNDGRCDRQGRFVVGGIDEDGLKPTSSIIRYDGVTVETIRGKEKLNSPIEQGVISQLLTHYANISSRIGKGFDVDENSGRIFDREAMKLWSRDYEPGWEPKL